MKKNWKKTSQEKIRIEKIIKRKSSKLYVKWKRYGNSFNTWIDKRDLVQWNFLKRFILLYKNESYFRKPLRSFGGNINVKADLSNYATKSDLKI